MTRKHHSVSAWIKNGELVNSLRKAWKRKIRKAERQQGKRECASME